MARPIKIIWSVELLKQFAEAYATTPNHELARRFNMSISSIRRKGKELNLCKDSFCKCKLSFNTWIQIQELFHDHSNTEIAKIVKVSLRSVERVASILGCRMLREEKNKVISVGIRKGLKSESRRRIFGINTKYNRPIGKDKSRYEAAEQLKQHGYIVIKGSMTAYYNDTMERYEDIENNAITNGFRLLLWE